MKVDGSRGPNDGGWYLRRMRRHKQRLAAVSLTVGLDQRSSARLAAASGEDQGWRQAVARDARRAEAAMDVG